MRAPRQIVITSCMAIAATMTLACGASQPDPAATTSWTDAVAESARDAQGDIVSTLRDTQGNALGILIVKSSDNSAEWSPADGAARSVSTHSAFSGGAGLQEANSLAYVTWKPGGIVPLDCQEDCAPSDWCCTCEASGGGSCGHCCTDR